MRGKFNVTVAVSSICPQMELINLLTSGLDEYSASILWDFCSLSKQDFRYKAHRCFYPDRRGKMSCVVLKPSCLASCDIGNNYFPILGEMRCNYRAKY